MGSVLTLHASPYSSIFFGSSYTMSKNCFRLMVALHWGAGGPEAGVSGKLVGRALAAGANYQA